MVAAVYPELVLHDADITRPQRRRRRLPLAERQRRVLAVFGADATDASLPTFRAVLVREVLSDGFPVGIRTAFWDDAQKALRIGLEE